MVIHLRTLLFLGTALCAGCIWSPRAGHLDGSLYVFVVQGIRVPEVTPRDAPFDVELSFEAASGCLAFDHIDAERTPGRVELAVVGRESVPLDREERNAVDDVLCAPEGMALVRRFEVAPPFESDSFRVVVRQVDGGTVERVVRVE